MNPAVLLLLLLLLRRPQEARRAPGLDLPAFRPSERPEDPRKAILEWEGSFGYETAQAVTEARAKAAKTSAGRSARLRFWAGVRDYANTAFAGSRTVTDGQERVTVSVSQLTPIEAQSLMYLASLQLALAPLAKNKGWGLIQQDQQQTIEALNAPGFERAARWFEGAAVWLGAVGATLGVILGSITGNPVVVASSVSALAGAGVKIGVGLATASTVDSAYRAVKQADCEEILRALGSPPVALVQAFETWRLCRYDQTRDARYSSTLANGGRSGYVGTARWGTAYAFSVILLLSEFAQELARRGWPVAQVIAAMTADEDGKSILQPYTRDQRRVRVFSNGKFTVSNENYANYAPYLARSFSDVVKQSLTLSWLDVPRREREAFQIWRRGQWLHSAEWFRFRPADCKRLLPSVKSGVLLGGRFYPTICDQRIGNILTPIP